MAHQWPEGYTVKTCPGCHAWQVDFTEIVKMSYFGERVRIKEVHGRPHFISVQVKETWERVLRDVLLAHARQCPPMRLRAGIK